MRGLWAAVVATGALAAHGAPLRETFGAATVDFSAGRVAVAGAAAADLHAPNAAVARVRAERTARLLAARRLAGALAAIPRPRLGCRGALPTLAAIEGAAARAPSQSIEWSSDGSVALTLMIALVELTGEAAGDAGVPEARAGTVLLDPEAVPRWFVDRDGACVAAPRFFDTWDEARAALGGGVVLHHQAGAGGADARVVAVVHRGGDSGGTGSAP